MIRCSASVQLCCVQLIWEKTSTNAGEGRVTITEVKEWLLVKAVVILKGDEVECIGNTLVAVEGGRKVWFRQSAL